jgi:hypothetical protein
MAKYQAAIDLAASLLTKKGGDLTVTRRTTSAFDPVTQVETTTSTEHVFKAIVLPPGKAAEFEVGSLVGKRAIQITFAQKDQTIIPEPGDTVAWQGYVWTIFWSSTTDPSGDGPIITSAYAER